MRGQITSDTETGDAPAVRAVSTVASGSSRHSLPPPDSLGLDRLPLGRVYCADELEVIEPPA